MNQHIVISRTESIGDLVLSLPMAFALKQETPNARITFLCSSYAADVARACRWVDEVLVWGASAPTIETNAGRRWVREWGVTNIVHVWPRRSIARWAWTIGIPKRWGTSRRWFHWAFCNALVSVSRSHNQKHEALFNLDLLKKILTKKSHWTLQDLKVPEVFGLNHFTTRESTEPCPKKKVIFHPKSKGSAREWPLDHFLELAHLLPPEKFEIYITGTQQEGQLIKPFLESLPSHIIDMTGKFTLTEFISFMAGCQALVAASTGPLHLAGALGLQAIGLYPAPYPINAKRWGSLGPNTTNLAPTPPPCSSPCSPPHSCQCMELIHPNSVAKLLLNV